MRIARIFRLKINIHPVRDYRVGTARQKFYDQHLSHLAFMAGISIFYDFPTERCQRALLSAFYPLIAARCKCKRFMIDEQVGSWPTAVAKQRSLITKRLITFQENHKFSNFERELHYVSLKTEITIVTLRTLFYIKSLALFKLQHSLPSQ